ncbi:MULTISPECIES: transposase family protein [Pseudonocardia]|uniref:IS5 family transposase n=1 Tax=Pseudonocardia saturnea TaxID=33909 RepID=A0ABQ0SA72_9PSEU|nr:MULTISPECIES: transposase family protein [Pseudonocardia]TDN75423.1 DDE superfamily endonuclease [Pseudonocardia autotrophica]TDN76308.1 DDE superfamily endonuclease [Pseudonocardia autotrophica]TDN76350.1 DDE superfamily endonuclease [Pseudonocardia autotrophica]TDN76408.1 DDE superfamily endonuclease [Pseudonocardia autotrophica]BBF99380.1 IS5 family transposase [Pseudonocardia autotrophica]
MLVYPSSMPVSNRALHTLSDALRRHRKNLGSRWRRLPPGQQALLVLAYLNKGETYTALACGFGIGTTTVFRYVREGVDVLAAAAPSLDEALGVARRKAFVILDGTLLAIDRVGMGSGYDRAFYSGKHKRHGVNVQVLADPAGRLVWASPALPGARHDMGAAREHGLIDALSEHAIQVVADTAYQGGGPAIRVPQRRRRLDPDTGRYRPLSQAQKQVNVAHARQRGPGERANAQLKSWQVLRKIRSCPKRATALVQAVMVLIQAR